MTRDTSVSEVATSSRSQDVTASLVAGPVLDHDAEIVQSFARKSSIGHATDARARSVALYYAVRDGISYEIFGCYLGERISASVCLQSRRGFCLHKAILYAASCRAMGIPCRLLATTVCNHITSPSIAALVGGNVFLHWYNEVFINGDWIKAAPIFNRLTCKMYGIEPLEFDGRRNSVAQPYHGGRTMEFLAEPIRLDNPTAIEVLQIVERHHPLMLGPNGHVPRQRDIRSATNRLYHSNDEFACASRR